MNGLISFTKLVTEKGWPTLLDAVFPPRCCGCTQFCQDPFCRDCEAKIKPIQAPFCESCGAPFDPLSFPAALCAHCRAKKPAFALARSSFHFEGPVREAVHRLKYGSKTSLASRLAQLMAETFRGDANLCACCPDYIVSIPLHRKRSRKRGYNQSQLLASELGRILNVEVAELLIRNVDTPSQVGLKRDDRAKNVRGAFQLNPLVVNKLPIHSKRILLVDDVMTTGATLQEAAKTLRKGGALEVCALTLAHLK